MLLGGVAFVIMAYLAILFMLQHGNPDFVTIDGCLDSGGRWNYTTETCEH